MKARMDRRKFTAAAMAGMGSLAAGWSGRRAEAKKLRPAYPVAEGPLTSEDYRALKAMAEQVYSRNRVTIAAGTFHVPSHGKYSSLFGWDSGWHAITMSQLNPEIAAAEIETLFSLQQENGRVSHDTHFPELAPKANWWSRLGSRLGESQFDEQGRSAMIDPPSYIIAAEKVFAQTGDRAWLDRILPRLERCLHYLTHERDLFGDGLVSVIHPWEAGTDSSPAYDEILGLNFQTPLGAPKRGLLYPRLLDYNAEFNWDPQEAKRRNRFVLEDLTFNSITIRACLSVDHLHRAIGNQNQAEKFHEQAQKMTAALDRINWVEERGCYFSRWDVKNPKLALRTTCASLLPLLTGLISRERAERLIKGYLMNPEKFFGPYVVPFNAKDEMARDKVYMEDLLLWRGHCIWTNMNWMMMEGLLNYGYTAEAREITRLSARMIQHEGFWEFYDYRNGQGKGQPNFNWPGLVLDMIHRTWPEAVKDKS